MRVAILERSGAKFVIALRARGFQDPLLFSSSGPFLPGAHLARRGSVVRKGPREFPLRAGRAASLAVMLAPRPEIFSGCPAENQAEISNRGVRLTQFSSDRGLRFSALRQLADTFSTSWQAALLRKQGATRSCRSVKEVPAAYA